VAPSFRAQEFQHDGFFVPLRSLLADSDLLAAARFALDAFSRLLG
jgi:hypothetical protein